MMLFSLFADAAVTVAPATSSVTVDPTIAAMLATLVAVVGPALTVLLNRMVNWMMGHNGVTLPSTPPSNVSK